MLNQLSVEYTYQFLLIFCRLGATMMLLPALSEAFISIKSRLIIGLILSLLMVSMVGDSLPPLPESVFGLLILAAKEIIIGVFIGTIAKIIMTAMHTAGVIIAFQSGLASASLFDPARGEQSTVFSVFLGYLMTMILFATNMHHLFLQGVIDSYHLFTPGDLLRTDGFMELMMRAVSQSFMIGFKIATPHIVVGLLLYLGAGVMGRLMPQMQVFFILLPIQLIAGFFILMITLPTAIVWFLDYYIETMGSLIYFGNAG